MAKHRPVSVTKNEIQRWIKKRGSPPRILGDSPEERRLGIFWNNALVRHQEWRASIEEELEMESVAQRVAHKKELLEQWVAEFGRLPSESAEGMEKCLRSFWNDAKAWHPNWHAKVMEKYGPFPPGRSKR